MKNVLHIEYCIILCYRFTSDESKVRKWVEAIRREKFSPTKSTRIRKAHFLSTDFVQKPDLVRLKNTAVRKKIFMNSDAIPIVSNNSLLEHSYCRTNNVLEEIKESNYFFIN